MDIAQIKAAIVTNVYHIPASKNVPLHQHAKHVEIFYCIAGAGIGILGDRQIPLQPGQTFVVPAGTMHTLRTDAEIYVASFLIPVSETPAPSVSPSAP
jgi:mannose-6-phosphate isomerase-like protein (cupin superfamily)